MKLSDFIVLNESQKKGTLLHQGVLIGKRSSEHQVIFLFQLPDFYVESYCNKHTKSVELFTAFLDPGRLHHYLNDIKLDDLLN